MKTLTSPIIGIFFTLFVSTNLYADCSFELFSISSTKNTKIIDFVEQLSDECEFTIIVTDPHAEKFLNTNLNKTHLKNLTINEVFHIILNENNLSYTLENNILKISYLTTKVFSIDYILSTRTSTTKTDITLSSSSAATQGAMGATAGAATQGAGAAGMQGSGATSESGVTIESNDEVKFWEELDLEFQSVINRPHDAYIADAPIINKNAGLITVTATVKQMARFEKYLKRLQEKVQLQVLIDVQILAVTMKEGDSTGVDWSQLYKLQNMVLSTDLLRAQNVATFTDDKITTANYPTTAGNAATTASLLKATGSATLTEVIKFLGTQGDVSAISNPKVLTLNNQPALITVGTEYFYKLTESTQQQGTGGGVAATTQNDAVQSVFAGILLDITPEISEDKTITLKINPSVSETTQDMSATSSTDRLMPPDLDRRQLSSVVTVRDGSRIILGGLISTKNTESSNQVPLLGSIPVLGYLFKYEESAKSTQELIIVIEPHIINKNNTTLSLKDLGYRGLNEAMLEPGAHMPKNEE
ncbi:pilus (MSHA type) biogenesis protein MshL [Sulfurimonas sp.]|nr:pilus (MSHA type) biogenesis protein MshL [Sulfurimonas sp.]